MPAPTDGADRAVEQQPVGIGKLPPRLGGGPLEGFVAGAVDDHRLLMPACGNHEDAETGA